MVFPSRPLSMLPVSLPLPPGVSTLLGGSPPLPSQSLPRSPWFSAPHVILGFVQWFSALLSCSAPPLKLSATPHDSPPRPHAPPLPSRSLPHTLSAPPLALRPAPHALCPAPWFYAPPLTLSAPLRRSPPEDLPSVEDASHHHSRLPDSQASAIPQTRRRRLQPSVGGPGPPLRLPRADARGLETTNSPQEPGGITTQPLAV